MSFHFQGANKGDIVTGGEDLPWVAEKWKLAASLKNPTSELIHGLVLKFDWCVALPRILCPVALDKADISPRLFSSVIHSASMETVAQTLQC